MKSPRHSDTSSWGSALTQTEVYDGLFQQRKKKGSDILVGGEPCMASTGVDNDFASCDDAKDQAVTTTVIPLELVIKIIAFLDDRPFKEQWRETLLLKRNNMESALRLAFSTRLLPRIHPIHEAIFANLLSSIENLICIKCDKALYALDTLHPLHPIDLARSQLRGHILR